MSQDRQTYRQDPSGGRPKLITRIVGHALRKESISGHLDFAKARRLLQHCHQGNKRETVNKNIEQTPENDAIIENVRQKMRKETILYHV